GTPRRDGSRFVRPSQLGRLQIRASQVQDIKTHAGQTTIQGWVPFDRVVTVAALPFVHHIRPPRYATRR
ncbi:hypothetical protein C2W62_51925, partial [Candidatus Entotheonella serta]